MTKYLTKIRMDLLRRGYKKDYLGSPCLLKDMDSYWVKVVLDKKMFCIEVFKTEETEMFGKVALNIPRIYSKHWYTKRCILSEVKRIELAVMDRIAIERKNHD